MVVKQNNYKQGELQTGTVWVGSLLTNKQE